MSTTETFHPFLRLPWELRAMIWEFTIQPREVDLRVVSRRIPGKLRKHLPSRTRVPTILQVCQESQYLGLYKQAFIKIHLRTPDFQLKYVWINWELDNLAVETTDLYYLRHESIQNSIQRLHIDRSRLYLGEIQHLQAFVKLKKLYLHGPVISGRFLRVFRENPLPCGQRNIIIHDTDRWGTSNSIELDELWARLFARWNHCGVEMVSAVLKRCEATSARGTRGLSGLQSSWSRTLEGRWTQ